MPSKTGDTLHWPGRLAEERYGCLLVAHENIDGVSFAFTVAITIAVAVTIFVEVGWRQADAVRESLESEPVNSVSAADNGQHCRAGRSTWIECNGSRLACKEFGCRDDGQERCRDDERRQPPPVALDVHRNFSLIKSERR